jgi:iron-sulfur cluster assembly protein
MFKVTEQAAIQISKAAKESDMIGLALRLAARRTADGSIEYGMGFDEIKEDDIHINTKGIDIVFEPSYTALLDGAVIDFVEIEAGDFRFIFLNPNDPHYIPPKEY